MPGMIAVTKNLMQVSLPLLFCALPLACVGVGERPPVQPEDTTWIQRGQTTREEITARFGEPASVMAVMQGDVLGDYAEYGTVLAPDVYEGPGYTSPFEPRPRGGGPTALGGASPEVLRPPLESIRVPARQGPVFWLLYDAQGVVRDFGFGEAAGQLE